MSTQSFVNQLIGLARDQKTKERKLARAKANGWAHRLAPDLFDDLIHELHSCGYFTERESRDFALSLVELVKSSDPRRKTK